MRPSLHPLHLVWWGTRTEVYRWGSWGSETLSFQYLRQTWDGKKPSLSVILQKDDLNTQGCLSGHCLSPSLDRPAWHLRSVVGMLREHSETRCLPHQLERSHGRMTLTHPGFLPPGGSHYQISHCFPNLLPFLENPLVRQRIPHPASLPSPESRSKW